MNFQFFVFLLICARDVESGKNNIGLGRQTEQHLATGSSNPNPNSGHISGSQPRPFGNLDLAAGASLEPDSPKDLLLLQKIDPDMIPSKGWIARGFGSDSHDSTRAHQQARLDMILGRKEPSKRSGHVRPDHRGKG
mmetsp:Transcript_6470/g.8766  ORF Transcript_6470/g.8766 Transcript_6470/m.8766 type:complete len:136 (+) Transcript_6470:98-505(+)|eukprot:CAMPEP_0196580596 /NCGR_PEP_ID=MMETSP1081-20130531/29510_1 /TAXON_ID=36882 /ORGANISM="Pyramimonas amylifera, Strain CCMP720" /LENGTH=135 /DNA_ID=CAMNT_0041900507 /DNA_START=96 /DNA_END=503 /DNA_ORIENTATION=+